MPLRGMYDEVLLGRHAWFHRVARLHAAVPPLAAMAVLLGVHTPFVSCDILKILS